MSIKKDNTSVTAVNYNSQNVNKVILDNKCVWCKPFTYTQGTLPTGVASLTCTRSSTDEPTALTGTIANGDTIYYDDKLYWAATASTGYRITAIKGSGSPVTVSGAITGTTASGLTSERISGTISQGTLPTGVASITCYRKAYNENSFSKYTGSTIYYGDQFYWTATAATEYNNPSLTYNSSSKVYTWNGKQGGSIDSVSASGLSAGTRKSFTISFGTTANKSLYGSWSSSSQTAYYGDKITVSGNSVICYKWDNNSTARWTVKVTASSNTAEYTYSAVTIAESSIASVTAAATFTAYNTRTLNSYTVTFSTTSGQYGSWGTASIQNVPYGTAITQSGNKVTIGSIGSSTFAPPSTTVQYNYANPTFNVPSSVTGATTITGGCTRSNRVYTIQWIGADGSTVLETDSNVAYNAVLTYNGSTPSKPSTDQYSYTFSAWKLGSTSGSTVTSGTTTNAGSTSSTTIKIYSTFTSTVRSYTITWKYLSAYPDTWATATQTYDYGTTPSRTSPSTVTNTSNTLRKVFTSWDNLATVTEARTITANYKTQVNATFQGTRCSAKIDGSTPSNGWTDINKTVTWTADPNCAFNSDGSTTTTTDTISTQKTNYTASANYVNVTKLTGTNCSTNFTTGWKSINDTITWTADPAYAFDTSNTTSKSVTVVPGENKYAASYVKRYTLTISATNASYGTYSVSRNSSPYQGASTGTLNSGDTIYYGDVLGSKYSPKQEASYGDWNTDSIAAPTFTTTGDETSGNLTIKNEAAPSAVLYYNTSNAVGGTRIAEVDVNAIKIVTGLEFDKQYYISALGTRTRTKYTYDIVVGEQYLGTECVTGDIKATFAFKAIPTTESGSIYSAVVPAKTAAQNKYTVTFSITSDRYGSWSTASIANVPYGTSITRINNTVTVGNLGSSTFNGPSHDGPYYYSTAMYDVPKRVTGATTVTGGCIREGVKSYTLSFTKNANVAVLKAWRTASPYQGATIGSESSPLLNGSGTAHIYHGDSLSMLAQPSQGYHLSESGSKTVTVTDNISWAPKAIANNYPVKIAAGDGINDVYLSSDPNATVGSPSGTEFTFGSTVYAFAQLIHSLVPAIIVPSGWVRVDSSGSEIYRVASKQLASGWNRDFGTINAELKSYAVTIKGSEGIDSVFINTNPDALSGSPSGTTFKATTTVYAFAAVNLHYVHRVPSSWSEVGKSGTSTVYLVDYTTIWTSSHDFGTITLPALYTVTVSSDLIGLSSAYLSTSSTATTGSSTLDVAPGTTVYGFAVLNSYKSASICTGWNLISGKANESGAIYRVGSKTITANTTYYINLFDKSDYSSVVFKMAGLGAGSSWTIKNHEIQSVSDTCKFHWSGSSVYAKYDDYAGSEHNLLLGTVTCPAGYKVAFTLTDSSGNPVSWDKQVSLDGPYVIVAWVTEDTTTT